MAIDPEGFKKYFDLYYEAIRAFLYYRVGDMTLAEDLAQEAFLRCWEKRSQVKEETVKAYLYTIATNLSINHLKRNAVRLRFLSKQSKPLHFESGEYQLELQEFDEQLKQALSDLPDGQREVFLMNRLESLRYSDIAERLNISVKAVEKRMSKALEFLRGRIKHKV